MSIRKSPTLVLNKDSKAQNQYQGLVSNVLPVYVRNEMLQGREHLVVPMVILTEGVHAGSQGPLLYTNEEMAKLPDIWNSKPVVVYHPEIEGKSVSACDPHILNTRSVGIMLNTKAGAGALRSEAWLDKALINKVDERISAAVVNKSVMELSTSLFVDNDGVPGNWNGEDYVGKATNFRADHLALLPDKIGACSVAKGAGFLRNEAQRNPEAWAGLKQLLKKVGLGGLISNELSFDNIRSQLCAAVVQKLGLGDSSSMNPGGAWPWVQDVYSNFFIYEYDGKLFQLSYTATETGVTLGGEQPVEVRQVTEYRTVAGTFVGNQDQPLNNTNTDMDKSKMILAILAAGATSGWSETDRPMLDKLTENQVKSIHEGLVKNAAPAPVPAPAAAPAPAPANIVPMPAPAPAAAPAPAPATVTANGNPGPLSMEQYIAQAPGAIREVLQNGVSAYNTEKASLIENITKNPRCAFTKEDLGNRPLGELRQIAALAVPEPTQNYANYGGLAPTPVGNAADDECLGLPSMEVAKK